MQLVAWSLSQGFPRAKRRGVNPMGLMQFPHWSLHITCSWNFPPSNFILEFHSSNFVIEIKVCKVSSKSKPNATHMNTFNRKSNPSISFALNWIGRQRTLSPDYGLWTPDCGLRTEPWSLCGWLFSTFRGSSAYLNTARGLDREHL